MSFGASDVTFRDIITIHGANYLIPRFQRAYSWNTDNAEDFYNDWYRPDLMAVVAVGDFDGDKIEEQILFSKMFRM